MPNTPRSHVWLVCRWLLIPAAMIFLAVFLGFDVARLRKPVAEIENNEFNLPTRPYNMATKLSFDLRLDLAKNWNGSNTTLIALLWGLFLLKGDKSLLARSDYPELGIFLLAHVPILVHWWAYSKYVELMTWVMKSASANVPAGGDLAGVPDFLHENVDIFPLVQQQSMIAAAALVAVLIFMIFFLKGDGDDQASGMGGSAGAAGGAGAGR